MTSGRRASAALLLTVVVLAGALAVCGGGGDDRADNEVRTPVPTAAPSSSTGTAGTAPIVPATVAPNADGVTLNVYFVRNDKVGTGHRRIARTPAVARAATELLLAGPTAEERSAGLTSAIPTGVRLLGVNLADGVLTIDLSNEFVGGADARAMRQRLAQVVFTLTQFESVVSVRFRIAGTPTTSFGTTGVTLDNSVGRSAFTDETPFILLETLAPGDVVNGSVRLAGMSNTFESNVRIRIVGADGRTLADTFTTGKGGMGTWGQFETTVPFERGANTNGTVSVFENSAKDGSVINAVDVPVRFA